MEQVDGATKCFSEVVVRDSDSLEKKTAAIRLAGPSKLQVFMYFFFSYIFGIIYHYLMCLCLCLGAQFQVLELEIGAKISLTVLSFGIF